MKFISLFTKTPDHKQFRYKPRYWDKEEEERKEREERIRREIERERGLQSDPDSPDGGYRSRIRGSFQAARRRSDKPKEELNKVLIRSGVLLFLVLFLMAFLTWGKDALWGLLFLIPLYFYIRFKR